MDGVAVALPLRFFTLSTTKKLRYTMSSSRIEYSEKYADEENEYRWVHIGCWKGRTG